VNEGQDANVPSSGLALKRPFTAIMDEKTVARSSYHPEEALASQRGGPKGF
jgi:hypothetical protein